MYAYAVDSCEGYRLNSCARGDGDMPAQICNDVAMFAFIGRIRKGDHAGHGRGKTSPGGGIKEISRGVGRRTIDPFAMFRYIDLLRRGHDGTPPGKRLEGTSRSRTAVAKQTHKDVNFVSAADIFDTLPA